ncbi:13137_t:CDS:2 [Gigaspora rosea]|nr:13137_t:CDS:2 [Gigaspora rosea]
MDAYEIARSFSELLLDLPEQPDQIPKPIRDALPFQLPLVDRKQVRAAAITLRLAYKFERLPESYIDDNREKLPDDPDSNAFAETIEQLNEQIQLRDLQSKWVFPLDRQEEFPEAVDFLRRNFLVDTIPEFAFNITSFPPPSWDLFNEYRDTDTHMQITTPQSNSDGLEIEPSVHHNE